MTLATSVLPGSKSRLWLEWLVVGCAVAAAAAAALVFRGREASAGDVRVINLSLVSADKDELSCAYGSQVDGLACAFSKGNAPFAPAAADGARLAPYVTTDRQLYLVAGLFAEPHVDARWRVDHAQNTTRRTQQRYVAECRVELVERIERFQTRWAPHGRWEKSGPAWVAKPLECNVR